MSRIRIALFVSLGINLFFVGWWIGDVWPRPPQQLVFGPASMIERAQQQISAESMAAISPALEAINEAFRHSFDDRNVVFRELREVVSATPYDAKAVEDLFATRVTARTQAEVTQWELVGNVLGQVSDEERAILAMIFFPLPEERFAPRSLNGGPRATQRPLGVGRRGLSIY